MYSKILARLGAFTFVAITVSAAAVQFMRDPESPHYRSLEPVAPAPNPQRKALRQCRDRGEAAVRDLVCLKIWADRRDAFLGVPGSDEAERRVSQEGR